ncbi:unnamed protein product [Merluccius merluccius]
MGSVRVVSVCVLCVCVWVQTQSAADGTNQAGTDRLMVSKQASDASGKRHLTLLATTNDSLFTYMVSLGMPQPSD